MTFRQIYDSLRKSDFLKGEKYRKMKILKTFVSAILAGLCIGFGGIAFLSIENKIVGAMFFTVGLFCVCSFGLHLFTGKVCYVFDEGISYALNFPVIWLGNLCGTGFAAFAVRFSRISTIAERAASICEVKVNDNLISLFILGILCNIFIYIGVDGYKNSPHDIGKYLSLFFGVMVFILCGFEHCVADMFYFWLSGMWSFKAVVCIIVVTAGNFVGGVVFPVLRKWLAK